MAPAGGLEFGMGMDHGGELFGLDFRGQLDYLFILLPLIAWVAGVSLSWACFGLQLLAAAAGVVIGKVLRSCFSLAASFLRCSCSAASWLFFLPASMLWGGGKCLLAVLGVFLQRVPGLSCVLSWCRSVSTRSGRKFPESGGPHLPPVESHAVQVPPGQAAVQTSSHQGRARLRPVSPSPRQSKSREVQGPSLGWLLLKLLLLLVALVVASTCAYACLHRAWSARVSVVHRVESLSRVSRPPPLQCHLRPTSWASPHEAIIPVAIAPVRGATWWDALQQPSQLLDSFYVHCDPRVRAAAPAAAAAAVTPVQLLPWLRAHAASVAASWSQPVPYEHALGWPVVLHMLWVLLCALAQQLGACIWAAASLRGLAWLAAAVPCSYLVLCARAGAPLRAAAARLGDALSRCVDSFLDAVEDQLLSPGLCSYAVAAVLYCPVALVGAWLVLASLPLAIRLVQVFLPGLPSGQLFAFFGGLTVYILAELCWRGTQVAWFQRRQDLADPQLSTQGGGRRALVRVGCSRHLLVTAGRRRRGVRWVSAVIGERSEGFTPDCIPLSLLRVVWLIAAHSARCAICVGSAGLRCAVQACICLLSLAAMAAAVLGCICVTRQLQLDTPAALSSRSALQHGSAALLHCLSAAADAYPTHCQQPAPGC